MRTLSFVICAFVLLCFVGCNRCSERNNNAGGFAVGDTIPADSILSLRPTVEVDTFATNDTVKVAHKPSAKELEELHDSISYRLEQLKNNPLQQNVWGIALLIDAVEVSLAINTPHWRNEFRKHISNSPYINFDGPTKSTPISELVDSVTEPATVKLRPDSTSFSVNSSFATFVLTNDSDREIVFGVDYIVGFKAGDGIWYKLPHPGIWLDMGITLLPAGKYAIKAALNPKLNNNKPGIYRLYKQIRFDGDKERLWLMTEFKLK